MNKTRVPKGEKYWYLKGNLEVAATTDIDSYIDASNWLERNYFHAEEEARSMLKKLRAVLKGADVIEMPSEEDIKASQDSIEDEVVSIIRDANGAQLIYCTAINKGAELMADWLKSKIVK